ncbi:MAG: MATE family efflux transporter [Anaerovoracaceae bacterium]
MNNSLQREFTFPGLIKFAIPTITMMIFTAMYTLVDGLFVSHFVGTDALSSVNIAYPFFNVIIAIGVMLGSGGSAIIAKKMGEGSHREAKENFSLILYFGIFVGLLIMLFSGLFMENLMRLLGADDNLIQGCLDYSYMILPFTIPTILQMAFQYLFVTAGNPKLGLVLTIMAGITNMILDYVFIALLDLGVKGAGLATGMGILIPSGVGFLMFIFNRKGTLCLVKPHIHPKVILKSCTNGASEMVTEMSNAIIACLYNIVMMRLIGSDGVAAISIILYLDFLMKAVFLGFAMGVAPIISYNYGSQNIRQLKKLFKYSISFVLTVSMATFTFALTGASFLAGLFAEPGTHVHELAVTGFKIYCFGFLFTGISIFSSAMFTAFSNGLVSAIISFFRTFLFLAAGLIILPFIIGVTGAWISAPVAEGVAMLTSVIFLYKFRNKYQYL